MWFELWQIGVMVALFAYAVYYTGQKFGIVGYRLGYEAQIDEAAGPMAKRHVDAVLDNLEAEGIIYREIDSDGEEVIYPVQYDEDNNRIS